MHKKELDLKVLIPSYLYPTKRAVEISQNSKRESWFLTMENIKILKILVFLRMIYLLVPKLAR
jgi:hypothetical protein